MSKLSPSLKALINAPAARPGPVAAPRGIRAVYERIAAEAARRRLGTRPWLAISAAATFTLNSPDSLAVLHAVAAAADPGPAAAAAAAQTAELMRDVGLKCISFNGIPRTINCLHALAAALPPAVAAALPATPARAVTPRNLDAVLARGRRLFDSVYAPLTDRLVDRLARAHPDLPVHILASHYAPLLADPPPSPADAVAAARTGRLLTSVVAVACLRAQTGVAPQVLSHVYGLRKAVEDGSWVDGWVGDTALDEGPVRWLAGDEGSQWILESVDAIVEALGGTSFATRPGPSSKL